MIFAFNDNELWHVLIDRDRGSCPQMSVGASIWMHRLAPEGGSKALRRRDGALFGVQPSLTFQWDIRT
jgi:hypothetical protein